MIVDLICFGGARTIPVWSLGSVHRCDDTPAAVADQVAAQAGSRADAWLFWDTSLGQPSAEYVLKLVDQSPGQVWHAGLKLGVAGLPGAIDFVCPTWMLNADAPADLESTSWRLSLRACLIRANVLRHCGGPRGDFDSIEASGLELGHRLIKSGALMRHTPALVPGSRRPPVKLSLRDEVHFLRSRFGRFWSTWAISRMVLSGYANPIAAARSIMSPVKSSANVPPFRHPDAPVCTLPRGPVTVLIPTIDRYPYLRKVLSQVSTQTVRPAEVIVIDQTPSDRRDASIAEACPGLPVRVLYLDKPGQCSARNMGLVAASGDYVLFIDDDDEIEPDLIERHLRCLARFGGDVSAGVADEAGAGPLPPEFTYIRMSDVFPTNNCMIRSELLQRTGLFDLAYDRGSRADGDLGMRAYLSGAVMILNPEISVFHHHAPMGGLRTHKARKITYASSRKSLLERHLPGSTELYLWRRYFNQRQLIEESWMRVLGTLAVRGGVLRRLAKAVIGLAMLPHTCWRIRQSHAAATGMLKIHPSIPLLERSASGAAK